MNRSVPTSSMLAHLVYGSVAEAADWLAKVFGFTEQYRYGQPLSGVQMHLGETSIMLVRPAPGRDTPAALGAQTLMLTVWVPDVEAHYEQSKQSGAKVWEELHETVYGERQYGVEDLDGHRWLFSQHARDVDPAEWGAMVAKPTS